MPPVCTAFVEVEQGVNVTYCDWGPGATGIPIVFLVGLGDVSLVFDDLAMALARKHRVIGVNRRGSQLASQPADGSPGAKYDVATRASDDLKVLDAIGARWALFVGHSVAGEELTQLGAAHSDRVAGLVYIEALYKGGGKDAQHMLSSFLDLESRVAQLMPQTQQQQQQQVPCRSLLAFKRRLELRQTGGRAPVPMIYAGAMSIWTAEYDAQGAVEDSDWAGADAIDQAGLQDKVCRWGSITCPLIISVTGGPSSLQIFDAEKYAAARIDPQLLQAYTEAVQAHNTLKAFVAGEFQRLLPRSLSFVVPDVGHYVFLEQPEIVRSIIAKAARTAAATYQ